MAEAIAREAELTARSGAGLPPVGTIYFGGGTPGLLEINELETILSAIHKNFSIAADAEITLEANPEDIDPARLREWKNLGINRLSIGVQSFDDTELKWMNRAHSGADSLRCLQEVKAAGFTNFSADLIYGSPLQSEEQLENNFRLLADLGVPHLSCYALTVEEKTVLAKRIREEKDAAPDPDKQSVQFSLLMKLAAAAGYEHYEISNFAKPGFRSQHNGNYWKGVPYFGFGPSAHSYDGAGKRRWNIANNNLYIQSIGKGTIPFEEEVLTADQRQNEYLMIALRTNEGIDLEYLGNAFGIENRQRVYNAAQRFIAEGLLYADAARISLTDRGKFLADGIAADLFQ